MLKRFIDFLGGGLIKERPIVSEFVLTKFILIKEKLVPLFQKYPIKGVKFENFKDFCKIVELMSTNAHATQEGLNKIREIKEGMNKDIAF